MTSLYPVFLNTYCFHRVNLLLIDYSLMEDDLIIQAKHHEVQEKGAKAVNKLAFTGL